MSEAEQIAAFIAKRGVTRVAPGEATLGHLKGRDWAKLIRAPKAERTTREFIDDRRLASVDAGGREYWVNGLGERIS